MRWEIINHLITENKYEDYLEIGVRDYYECCAKIIAKNKTAVDPVIINKCDYVMTSDAFFELIPESTMYDIVFVDGLHIREQVYKDIVNSLNHLRKGGTIVVHDCLPETEGMQLRENNGGAWMGDVWKAIVDLKSSRSDLEIYTVDHDCGCAIIRKGKQKKVVVEEDLTWESFLKNNKNWLNVISYEDFYKKYTNK